MVRFQLAEEAFIWFDATATALDVMQRLLEGEIVRFHGVRNDNGRRTADAHFTVDQHFGAGRSSARNVLERVVPVLEQIRLFVVVHTHVAVVKLAREKIVNFASDI